MYMPLTASEDGIVQFVKQPGVSLEPGDILGILTLDDPARVKHAKPFEGLLPPTGNPAVIGNKPHQRLAYYFGILTDILDGLRTANPSLILPTITQTTSFGKPNISSFDSHIKSQGTNQGTQTH